MPLYEYLNLRTGRRRELFRRVSERDVCPAGLQRLLPRTHVRREELRRDPTDVEIAAPAGLKAMEEQYGSVDFERKMGMPLRKLKEIWAPAMVILALWLTVGNAVAAQIVRATTFVDGQVLTPTDLHNLVDDATIGPAFFNDQTQVYTMGNAYEFLVLDPATQRYRTISVLSALYTNTALASSLAGLITTNYSIGYTFNQVYKPWLLFTPAATNLWGSVVFPITNLTMATHATLTDTDSVPLLSGLQYTNTTVTLDAIYQYFTNRNALPNYTQARIQFSGYQTEVPIQSTVAASENYDYFIVTTNHWFNTNSVYAVSLGYSGGGVPLFPGMTTNSIFYVTPTLSNTLYLRVFDTYAKAATLEPTNAVNFTNSGSVGTYKMYYLTNYTGYNADVVQVANGSTPITAVYNVYFRTAVSNANYYIHGSCLNDVGGTGRYLQCAEENYKTTSYFRISTFGGTAEARSRRVEVLVSPE